MHDVQRYIVVFKEQKEHTEWILHDCFNTRKFRYLTDIYSPSQEEMSQVLDAMFEKFCIEGEHIIDQDDDGDNFYVIER